MNVSALFMPPTINECIERTIDEIDDKSTKIQGKKYRRSEHPYSQGVLLRLS